MTEQQSQIYEVLKTFAQICQEHNLCYWITGGTLLGAVRHQGFIPWDDDVDVEMPEADYRRFLQLSNQLPEGYVLQNEETDPSFPFLYTKLCNTAVPYPSQFASAPLGAHIDIFYLIPAQPLNFLTKLAFSQVKLIDYALRGKLGWREYVPNGKAARLVYRMLLTLPVSVLRSMRQKAAERIRADSEEWLCSIGGPYHADKEFSPGTWYESTAELTFEGLRCSACQGWNAWLTGHYGDYMTLPEKEKQISHHEQING